MSLKITHDGTADGSTQERCCMCRIPTRWWYAPSDVALCPDCARTAKRADLPTKREWCDKEFRLMPKWPYPLGYMQGRGAA